MQAILTLCGLAIVLWGLSALVFWRVGRGLQTGQAGTRGVVADRRQQPAVFWLILGLYTFAGVSLFVWGLMVIGMMGLYWLDAGLR